MTKARRTSRSDPPSPVVLSGREMDVMAVLWRLGSGTVSELQEKLDAELKEIPAQRLMGALERLFAQTVTARSRPTS